MKSLLLIALAVLSLQLLRTEKISDLESIEDVTTFTIKSMVVDPNPPKRAKKATTTIVYTSSVPQPVSKVHIDSYLNGGKVDGRDVQNVVTMEADKEYTWVYSDTIPIIAPPGNYKVEYKFMDPTGKQLGMIVNEFKL